MVNLYVIFALLYALFSGFFNVSKKKAIGTSREVVILVMFSLISFFISLIWIPFGVMVPLKFILILAFKGLIVTLSFYLLLTVLRETDVSVASLTKVLSYVITFLVGILLMGESATILQIIGAFLIIVGAVLINLVNKKATGKINKKSIILLLLCAIISSLSNIIDKYTTTYLEPRQVQFWFLLFLFVFSCLFFIIESIRAKKFLIQKSDLKNYWIYVAGIIFFIGDIFLFLAYTMPGGQMILITALSKFNGVVTVIAGILLFKEKDWMKKIFIALMMFIGVLLITI